ncbi:hypothetical protein Tco_0186339 [Tanacetum coccineum]
MPTLSSLVHPNLNPQSLKHKQSPSSILNQLSHKEGKAKGGRAIKAILREEARLFAISKPEVIKVVREEAKKLGIHLKEAITTKAGEKFKKAQDAEHEVHLRGHLCSEKKEEGKTPWNLKPGNKIPGLECNRALPKNVSFINNVAIKEP